MTESAHDGKTVQCMGEVGTKSVEVPAEHPDGPGLVHSPEYCDRELSYQDHGRFESPARGERRERFEAAAIVFKCPDCGHETAICPICTEPSDNSPAGWIDGSDQPIPCHNCNQDEIRERIRHHGHAGTWP